MKDFLAHVSLQSAPDTGRAQFVVRIERIEFSISDPFWSECGRFPVKPGYYGLTMAQARWLDSANDRLAHARAAAADAAQAEAAAGAIAQQLGVRDERVKACAPQGAAQP